MNHYSFIMKAFLTEEALDSAGRINSLEAKFADLRETAKLVGLDALSEEEVASAQVMSVVYTAIAAFENSVRKLISKTLLENVGEDWWQKCVSEKIRLAAKSRMDDEEKVRWHVQRGLDPVQFTMLPNLLTIVRLNFEHFEPFIHDINWAASIFETIERSRNVIMHSGVLGPRDVARVGSLLRDWSQQVAA